MANGEWGMGNGNRLSPITHHPSPFTRDKKKRGVFTPL
jgi:hypothetical protein